MLYTSILSVSLWARDGTSMSEVRLSLSWWMIGIPPHGVSRQWAVVVRYGVRQALACQADLKAAGLSCSTTTAGSWFQSPTVLAANELRCRRWTTYSRRIALNLNRWFAVVLLSAATKPIWSGPTATCPAFSTRRQIAYLTMLIFAVGWALCGWPQPRHKSRVISLFGLVFHWDYRWILNSDCQKFEFLSNFWPIL